jgi:murein DD-endopeptidase MepM/ murein hydrolase activator NlpD
MSDRFFTFMIVPERSDKIRKITLPTLYLRIASVAVVLLFFVGIFIFFDYLHILSQVAENKTLRVENNVLRVDVQSAKNKLEALDQSVTRLKSFAQKLRVIGNLDSPQGSQLLKAPASTNRNSDGSVGPGDNEEGGSIEDPNRQGSTAPPPDPMDALSPGPDLHSQLEYQRSMSMRGEVGPVSDQASLVDQVAQISEASVNLREQAELEEQNFAELQEMFQDRVDRLLHTPSILPTRGWITSEFGYRYNPFSATRTFHAGMDIANRAGTSVLATADGVVTYVGVAGGFGNVVIIDHGYNLVTKFGHNSKIVVHKGDHVHRGQKISEMGSTGRSTGPHCHYQVEVRHRPVNPRYFILEDSF